MKPHDLQSHEKPPDSIPCSRPRLSVGMSANNQSNRVTTPSKNAFLPTESLRRLRHCATPKARRPRHWLCVPFKPGTSARTASRRWTVETPQLAKPPKAPVSNTCSRPRLSVGMSANNQSNRVTTPSKNAFLPTESLRRLRHCATPKARRPRHWLCVPFKPGTSARTAPRRWTVETPQLAKP
jgi:hypothetical protein